MASVNLKKYIKVGLACRFVPVLEINGKPQTGTILIDSLAKQGLDRTFFPRFPLPADAFFA